MSRSILFTVLLLCGYIWLRRAAYPSIFEVIFPIRQPLAEWALLYHLGGNGPWIPRAAEGSKIQLPMKCEVKQAHMISRHAERYPTTKVGIRHLELLKKLQSEDVQLSGSLVFLNDWQYFTDQTGFESLTTEGRYAGTLQAYETGKKLRQRYGKLVRTETTTRFWTCGSQRNVETAKCFANGFFGNLWNEEAAAELVIIPEAANRGADTLTPGDTCKKCRQDAVYGHDRGYGELEAWQKVFTAPIAARLKKAAGGMDLSHLEIYSMMEICGFELLARGASPWCEVFSHEEWLDFEYGRDILHFYRAGLATIIRELWASHG